MGRNASVAVSDNAMRASDSPNSFPIVVRQNTTRKKSNASSVQPRKLAQTADKWSTGG